jgi:hypothetical protein
VVFGTVLDDEGAGAWLAAADWDACCCWTMESATELVGPWSLGQTERPKHKSMKSEAKIVVNLVQKVLPLVPKRLWPVPAKRPPPALLGCWIRMTPIKSKAVKTNKVIIKVCMVLPKKNSRFS